MTLNWIKAKKYAEQVGTTVDALNGKRKNGTWLEEIHWIKAPDGKIYYNWQRIEEWIEHGFK